jgi:hypothetical protein
MQPAGTIHAFRTIRLRSCVSWPDRIARLHACSIATGHGNAWTQERVRGFRNHHEIAGHRDGEWAERGEITLEAAAKIVGVGRSPDDGDAIVMCMSEGSRAAARQLRAQRHSDRPDRANVGYSDVKRRFRG